MQANVLIVLNDVDVWVDVEYHYDEPEMEYHSGTGTQGGWSIISVKHNGTDITALCQLVNAEEMIMDYLCSTKS